MPVPTTALDYDALRAAFRWDIPARFNMAHALCTRHAQATPDAPALIFVEADGLARTFTFGELDRFSSRLAHVLAAHGVTPGTIVGINLPQCPETVIAQLAILRLGAIVLPLAVLFGPDALRYRLEDSGALVLITSAESHARCREACADVPTLRHTFVVNTPSSAVASAAADDFWRLLEQGAPSHAVPDTASTAPAVMLYTSGTTGQPKGVLHAHRMILASTAGMAFCHGQFPKPGDRMWTPADWAWAGGLNILWTALFHGRAIVAERSTRFDPERAIELMHRHNVRNALIPPTALRSMRTMPLGQIKNRCHLRTLVSGGEALGSDMIDWGREAFGVTLTEGFGQSEAFLPIGNNPDLFAVRPGSMGRALPGHEIAVLDETGTPVVPGQPGQLALRAPNPLLFLEYRGQPAATAAKYKGDWFLFGDIVTQDADGYIWFHGRDDDVINSSGYRIGPQEVEDCLLSHPAIRLAGVVGTPDPVRGEVVTAFVVLRDGHMPGPVLAADIQAFVRRQLATHQYPRHIRFIDEMPLTVTGKIRRLDLRERARHSSASDQGPLST